VELFIELSIYHSPKLGARAAMPSSKVMIDPFHLPAIRAAFDRVCATLGLNCERDEPLTDLVVMFIVSHAQEGELDPNRLCELTLRDLAQQYSGMVQESRPTLH
jgi:hypothetical protein